MRWTIRLTLLCVLILCAGCSTGDTGTGNAGIERTASDRASGTELRVRIEHDRFTLADRVWVLAEWSWDESTTVALSNPDWGGSDWMLIETIEAPVVREGNRYTASTRWLIEPFLPGEYAVPSPLLRTEHEGRTNELRVEPIQVTIEGVLPDRDTGELNPMASPVVPQYEQQRTPLIWLAIAAGTILTAGVVLLLLRRGQVHQQPESTYAMLQRIQDEQGLDRQTAFEMLEQAFGHLDPRLRETSEFREMIRACERARFAPEKDARISPSRIARHALELLGHEPRATEPGGVA